MEREKGEGEKGNERGGPEEGRGPTVNNPGKK